ncbi:MAG TPA: VOC family protein [Candidatus Binataceae bacterium]|nr:VOC family protein [Candidatus Binataceae bacterium]
MIKSLFHVNVNCSNFERSLRFYQMLGFKVALDIPAVGSGNSETGRGLGLPNSVARAAIMTLSDDPHATRLDLIEWTTPRDEAKPYAQLNHLGIARIALFTKGLREEYQRLKGEGVSFISEPVTIRTGAGEALFACFYDPDGTILELIEPGAS